MKLRAEIGGAIWEIDQFAPLELGITLKFDGPQPRAFGLQPARSWAVEAGEFVGDTRRGGSANCETIELTPHGNGTHTEGVGHLTEARIPVGDVAPEPLIPLCLVTTPLRRLGDLADEDYGGRSEAHDRVVSKADLQASFQRCDVDREFGRAVALRIDSPTPIVGDHSDTNPPYLTRQATQWLRDLGCRHFLVELPSVDRESDGGTLPNHHLFFGIQRKRSPSEESRERTITEMISVPDKARDGAYVLSLRLPRFQLDAAPSRPILYSLLKRSK